MNDDGHLSGQPGVNDRFGKKLVNRYALFFYLHPNPASVVTENVLVEVNRHVFD